MLSVHTTWPIATDGVAWSACLLAMFLRPAKTDEPIEMPFGGQTRVSPRNHALDGDRDLPRKWAILGVVRPTEKHWESVLRRFTQ